MLEISKKAKICSTKLFYKKVKIGKIGVTNGRKSQKN